MKLCHLKIEHLRNISSQNFEPAPGCNLITGDNGAGKTSLLEAIYLLARAKSFRSSKHRSPIQQDQSQLTLFAELEDESQYTHRLGLMRQGSSTLVKLDGQQVHKLSELATLLPVLLITPNSHRIIEEGPEHRRRLLNWGVFHVEHGFKSAIQNFNRSLLQRNNALRKGSLDLQVWNQTFLEHAQEVTQHQVNYFQTWKKNLLGLTSGIDYLRDIEVLFSPGWNRASTLKSQLEEREYTDRERGFTSVGPQRADVQYRINGDAAKQRLSRGQQKVLISCAILAQSITQKSSSGIKPIILFDDLDSELDDKSLAYLLQILLAHKSQAFITSINASKFESLLSSPDSGMFHVEHGAIERGY